MISRRLGIRLFVLACAGWLATSCAERHELRVRNPAGPTRMAMVTETPPEPQVEEPGKPPDTNYVWAPGYWEWQDHWVWVSGSWMIAPRPQAVWVPGHWRRTAEGWEWLHGYWR